MIKYWINDGYEVKNPERGTKFSAGIDFFVPSFNEEFLKNLKGNFILSSKSSLTIHKGKNILIPSGISISIPENTALILFNKSSIASKYGLVVGACVIDSDYKNQVFFDLHNIGDDFVTISENQKIVQGILTPILFTELEQKSSFEELTYPVSDRIGGFGSTGN